MYQAAIKAGLTDPAARVMAAQAAIESGYGDRAPGNNFFAITKGDQWTGPTIKRTDRDAKGNPIVQEFRSYDSPEAGIADRIAFMEQRFPGFNKAATTQEALAALQNGVKGKYYEAPRGSYEATVAGINKKYLADVPVARTTHPVPPADVPFSPNTYLGGKQYGKPGGGVGVNADKLHPEFANRMAALVQAAEEATGDKVSVFEGYRDPARQAQLRANYLNQPIQWEGKTYAPNGKGYKAAPPGQSEHQLGMAADIRAGTDPEKAPTGPAFDFMREHAAEYGLHWFGSSDPAHFEMPEADYKTALAGGNVAPFKLPTQPKGDTAVASALDIAPGGNYTVKSGDNLSKIAKAHGTTVEALTAANSLTDPNKLAVGQLLNVGQSEMPPLPRPRPTLGGGNTLAQALAGNNAPAPLGVRSGGYDRNAYATGDGQDLYGSDDGVLRNRQLMSMLGPKAVMPPRPEGGMLGGTPRPMGGPPPAPPLPMPGRPASLNAMPPIPGQQAPMPMPGRPAGLNSAPMPPAMPAQTQTAPPATPKLLRLPSGAMIAPGSYDNAKSGIPYTVTEGPNGTAVIHSQRAGFLDIGKEMNAPTLAGGFIRSKIAEMVPQGIDAAASNFAPAAQGAQTAATQAIQNAAPGAGNALQFGANQIRPGGIPVATIASGLFGSLFGGPPAVPRPGAGWGDMAAAPIVRTPFQTRRPPMPLTPSPMLRSGTRPAVPQPPPAMTATQRRQAQQNDWARRGLNEFGMLS